MTIHDLRTPAFLVDYDRLAANCRLALETARRLGVRLRPHVKTHKTLEGARLQTGGRPGPITVSTLAEAEFYAEAGFGDITYAVPPDPGKLPELARLASRIGRLNLVIDHSGVVSELERYSARHGDVFDVFLKIDCGNRRVGIDPQQPEALEAALGVARSRALRLHGVLTHAGQSYQLSDPQEKRRIALWEAKCLADFAVRLGEHQVPCEEVSVGSTPTLMNAPETLPGVTEMRPGNYVFFDQMQVDLGNCRPEQVAATVLASVIGVYPSQNRLVVDAGALALSKDPGCTGTSPQFGRILEQPDWFVAGMSQEHGLITSSRPMDFSRVRVGTRVRIVPNHSCLAAALFPSYHVVRGETVVDRWFPVRGW
jgi:D-serine deaminase-like pyridoxal phosphate-dependent protein